MKEKSIVCLSMTTWEGDYMKTIVHMMSQLAKDYNVLFVDYPFTYKDLLFSALGKSTAPAARMVGLKPRLRKLEAKGNEVLHLTLPPVFPTNWIGDFAKYKKAVATQTNTIAHSINKAMQKVGMKNPVIINAFNPLIGLDLVDKLNESCNIYYCYDEIRAAQWCGKHGGKMEDLFIKKIDAVVTTSAQLQKNKSLLNEQTHLVKNGVDFELFSKGHNANRLNQKTKVIGYLGSIDFRLDYDLLCKTITHFPEHEFHFVGRVSDESGKARLQKFSNVKFTGALQPNQIPEALSKFDLGLIPFVANEFTKNVYPLKINEYLAAGVPVVSTNFADLSDFEDATQIATTEKKFISAIDQELNNDAAERMQTRQVIAQQNDWSSRAQQMTALIESLTSNNEK